MFKKRGRNGHRARVSWTEAVGRWNLTLSSGLLDKAYAFYRTQNNDVGKPKARIPPLITGDPEEMRPADHQHWGYEPHPGPCASGGQRLNAFSPWRLTERLCTLTCRCLNRFARQKTGQRGARATGASAPGPPNGRNAWYLLQVNREERLARGPDQLRFFFFFFKTFSFEVDDSGSDAADA